MEEKKESRKIEESYKRRGLMIVFSGTVLILIYYFVNHFSTVQAAYDKINSILMPFYAGLIMAYLLCPIFNAVTRGFYRRNHNRFRTPQKAFRAGKALASIISVIVLLGVIIALILMILPGTIESITTLIPQINPAIDTLTDWVSKTLDQNPDIAQFIEEKLTSISDNLTTVITNYLLPGTDSIINAIFIQATRAVKFVINFIVAIIISVYVLNSKEMFMAQARKLILAVFKKERAENIFELAHLTNQSFGGFVNGKIIDSIIIGIICGIAMRLLGIPLAMLVAVIVGVTNFIPFFGPFIGAIPSLLLIVIISPIGALKFLILILVLQQFDGNILGPKILGKTTKLASFWVLFSIIVFGGLFGVVGMIIGVPVFAVIYTYISRWINSRLKKKDIDTDTFSYEDYGKYDIDKEEFKKGKTEGYGKISKRAEEIKSEYEDIL